MDANINANRLMWNKLVSQYIRTDIPGEIVWKELANKNIIHGITNNCEVKIFSNVYHDFYPYETIRYTDSEIFGEGVYDTFWDDYNGFEYIPRAARLVYKDEFHSYLEVEVCEQIPHIPEALSEGKIKFEALAVYNDIFQKESKREDGLIYYRYSGVTFRCTSGMLYFTYSADLAFSLDRAE